MAMEAKHRQWFITWETWFETRTNLLRLIVRHWSSTKFRLRKWGHILSWEKIISYTFPRQICWARKNGCKHVMVIYYYYYIVSKMILWEINGTFVFWLSQPFIIHKINFWLFQFGRKIILFIFNFKKLYLFIYSNLIQINKIVIIMYTCQYIWFN